MNFTEFQFDRTCLAMPRKPGISAYMRIKNEEQFVRLSIESHLPFYDEIIACYNDCTDNTEAILRDIAKQNQKVKVFQYLPRVHPACSKEHAQTSADDVHGMANYSNYALSKCSYSFAAKLDADHLAIPCKLARMNKIVRHAIATGVADTIYNHSAINLMRNTDDEIGIAEHLPFAGNGEYVCHPVCDKLIYTHDNEYEKLTVAKRHGWKKEFCGITTFHLKFLKPNYGLLNYSPETQRVWRKKYQANSKVVTFAEFCTPVCRRRLIRQLSGYDRRRVAVYQSKTMRRLKFALTGKNVRLHQIRLIKLPEYLDGIDFQRDALEYLQ